MRKVIFMLALSLLLTGQPAPQPAAPELHAACAVLMGPEGQILYEKDGDKPCLIASTTKLMTALLTLDLADPAERVRIPAACCEIEGSSMYLAAGEEYSVEELLTGLLLASGNDAALALAVHCAGDEASFVARMNEKAAALGLEHSHFANPHGLDDEENYASAEDLGILMLACLEQPLLVRLLGTRTSVIREQSYVNHNKLLWSCQGCLGGKTGYTMAAGRCLVSCCEREGTRLVCVTLSDPEDWEDHKLLYAWGFTRYVCRDLTENLCYSLPVYGGEKAQILLKADPLALFLPKDAVLRLRVELPPFVLAPVRAGETGGRVTLFWDGKELGSVPLRFCEDLPAGEQL